MQIYYQGQGKALNEQFASNLELLNDDGVYNYVAYLMADYNNISIKFAKYAGTNRVELIENNEFGLASLIKATHQILDKVKVENKTLAKITERERQEKNLWHPVALREAIVNALVHNDYSREIAPKFEIFDDRIEITSYGGLPLGFTQDEFFKGHSVPRNKEIMRIFRDLDMVEQLGSGIPRILEHYSRSVFEFTENFLRIVFPMNDEAVQRNTEQVAEQVAEQVKNLIKELDSDMDRQEIQNKLGLLHREHFRVTYLKPALTLGLVEMTIPEKPNSKNQRYRLTAKGVAYRNNIVKK